MLASPLAGGARWAVRALGVAAAAVPVALLLLVPWPWSLVGSGTRGPLGVVFRPDLDVSEVLRFETGPAGAGWTGWGLLAAAALPLAVASGPRLAWATRAWSLALVGFAAVWVPSRFFPDELVPAPEGALSLAALGLALAVGLGVGAVVEDLRRAHFGWRQLASVAAVAALAAPALGFLADAGDGRWHAPGRDWVEELSWMDTEVAGAGAFRVLWLGDPSVLPLDPAVRPDGLGYGLTRDGPGDLRDLWPAPVRGTDRLLAETVDLAAQGRTSRLGHALAPMSVRYVAVVERPGPEAGARVAAPPLLLGSLQEQLDLARLESEAGLVLYENTAWAPTRAVVTGDDETVPLDTDDPKAAAMRTELDGAVPVHGPLRGSRPVPSGMLLWSEAYDTRWRAGLEGDALEHVRTFGWANGYEVPAGGSVSLRFDGQWARYGLLTLQVALWVGWAVLLSLAGGRDPSSGAVAGPAGPATPHERGTGDVPVVGAPGPRRGRGAPRRRGRPRPVTPCPPDGGSGAAARGSGGPAPGRGVDGVVLRRRLLDRRGAGRRGDRRGQPG
ncbi:MAG: hypothetical protein M5U14_11025 [Acidimicrobiia bacterium]|nr:hypothetical protein [Acidimicrobiia bacterium]